MSNPKIKNRPYRIGAIAFVQNSNGELLLVQHNDYLDNEWNFPGGGREKSETPVENATRELKEELGIDAVDLELIGVSRIVLKYDFPEVMVKNKDPIAVKFRGQQKEQVVFRYKAIDKQLQIEPREIKRYKWCAIPELNKHLLFEKQHDNASRVLDEFGMNNFSKVQEA